MSALKLEGVRKSFGEHEVLRGIDLELAEALRDSLERDEVAVRAHAACARSRFSRSLIMWSVKRASGIVIATNSAAAAR